MAQPYRLNVPGGVVVEATGEIIYPGDEPDWKIYEAWLATQPGPFPPATTVPAGTGLLPHIVVAPTLAESRTEMLARLDGFVGLRRARGQVVAVGHTWQLSDAFVLALAIHAAVFPPVPAGFTLPNAARVQVALNNSDFAALLDAISARLIAVNANYAALVTAINASATPLTINLEAGWPS